MMACPWLGGLWKPGYAVYILVGRPGAGKTTAALNLVAYDLVRRRVVDDYRDALREAGRRLFLGRSLEELFEYILHHADNPVTDWLIIDDAAVGFHDFADPLVWSKFVDIVKTARNSIAHRGIIFTTTSVKYLSTRVRHSAYVYYVKREMLRVKTYALSNRCEISAGDFPSLYTAIVEVETTLEGLIHYQEWHKAELVTRWRLAGAIPVSPEFAMPHEVEETHIRARKERVRRAAEEALERIRRRRASDVAKT
jgi:KaiC/GvpD/RAD55 family RecA-like ATPase